MSDFLSSLRIAATGLHAQNARMRVIAENLANADSTGKTPEEDPYRRRIPEPSRYLEVEMPPRFALEAKTATGDWILEAICTPDQFDRLEDGSYICSHFGSGLWIRCVADHGDWFEHEDGGGGRHRYRLVSLPEVD